MAVMLVSTEQGITEVTSKEQAKRMILATATVWMCTIEELKQHKTISQLAHVFKINLDDIKRTMTEYEGELQYGYPYNYQFK